MVLATDELHERSIMQGHTKDKILCTARKLYQNSVLTPDLRIKIQLECKFSSASNQWKNGQGKDREVMQE